MSESDEKLKFDVRQPRDTTVLMGHAAAEATLLDAYRSGRMAHGWLIGGPAGIGKATLAYRMARFVLANPDPSAPRVRAATSLEVDPEHPVARLFAAGAHGGLLTLQRTMNEKGALRQVIRVEEVRETVSFFGSTAAAGGWRVCVVDTVDELNAHGANALLKILEEPPARGLLLLISDSPARLLPTILSRCRRLTLRPLAQDELIQAVAHATGVDADTPTLREAAALADGSVSRALTLMSGRELKLQRSIAAVLDTLPALDPLQVHAIGDLLPLNDRAGVAAFAAAVGRWIEQRVAAEIVQQGHNPARLARLAEVWEKIGRAARDTQAYNLERRPLVFSVFGLLAEATA